MKKFYEKNETLISLGLIVIYLITNSYCMNNFGLEDIKTLIANIILTVLIVMFVLLNKLGEYNTLSKTKTISVLYTISYTYGSKSNRWNKYKIICNRNSNIYGFYGVCWIFRRNNI